MFKPKKKNFTLDLKQKSKKVCAYVHEIIERIKTCWSNIPTTWTCHEIFSYKLPQKAPTNPIKVTTLTKPSSITEKKKKTLEKIHTYAPSWLSLVQIRITTEASTTTTTAIRHIITRNPRPNNNSTTRLNFRRIPKWKKQEPYTRFYNKERY